MCLIIKKKNKIKNVDANLMLLELHRDVHYCFDFVTPVLFRISAR